MKIIVLDFTYFDSAEKVHRYIAEKLGFPEYYGENLDALYDVLSVWPDPVRFYLFLCGREYEKGFSEVISDVSEENSRISFYCAKLPE